MSNPQPLGPQPQSANDSLQSLDPKAQSHGQGQGIIWALKGQLLLTAVGAIYAAVNPSVPGLSLWIGMGGLAYFSLTRFSRWQASNAQLRQKLHDCDRELSSLTAVNQSLSQQPASQQLASQQSTSPQLASQADLIEQLQQAEAAALQSEKMATLGMLMAGVAHEINTPLGAIQASAENLGFSLEQTLKYLPQLCRCLDEAQLISFTQLLTWANQDPGNRSSRQERQLKRELKAKLETLNIDNARKIAAILSPMGIEQDLQPLLPILQSPDADMILEAAYNLNAIQDNGQNISIAIGRANNIVASLRNYARKGSQVKPTLSDLRTGIDTVLTLYQNKLKHGIELQKQYDDVPQLLCYPEELDQAWANIIGNAIQAMEGQGRLEISLTEEEENLIVTITDSGPGIPEASQAQIFTPYFTTKPMGEGSGLGLSITQKIIQRHHGSITLESTPGQTRFRISLPLDVNYDLENEAALDPGQPAPMDGLWPRTSGNTITPPPNDTGTGTAESSDGSSTSARLSASPPEALQVPIVP